MSKKMTPRERVMAVFNGEEPDLTPFLVYTNMRLGSQGGWIRRAVERGAGIVGHSFMYMCENPFQTLSFLTLSYNSDISVNRKSYFENGVAKTIETIETPVGSVSQILRNNVQAYLTPNYEEHFVKKTSDWRVINYIYKAYSDALQPSYLHFQAVEDELGENGITYAWIEKTAFPRAWVEIANLQQALMDFYMESPEILEYIDIQDRMHEKIADICAESPCKYLQICEHISDVVSPSYYRKYCLPVYNNYAKALAGTDKLFGAHLCGRMGHLKKEFAESPYDVYEAFTPLPNGDVSLTEAMEIWPNMIIMMHLPVHLSFAEPKEMEAFFESIKAELKGSKKRFMFVHAEDIPLEKLETMLNIAMDVFGY